MPKPQKQHPHFSFKAAKFLADSIFEKYGGRVDEREVPEEIMEILAFYGLYDEVQKRSQYTREEALKLPRELHKQYGDEMPVSLLHKEVVEALIQYGYVEPIYKDKKPS
jgi:hypothetical protein